MTIKKIAGSIHLWLGLTSGLVIVFLGITGCILAFEKEVREITDPAQLVAAEHKPYLLPERLRKVAEEALPGKQINSLEYPGKNKAALASYYTEEDYFMVALNPYSGEVLAVKNMNRDFFRVVLDGHFYLWLPPRIGQPIVASATLIFLIMLVTGLILWWPKNKAAQKQRFSVKWNARWRRVNYDLHSVLGFYMSWVAIFIAVTGLVWGFEWFASSFYRVTSFGGPMPAYTQPLSDTLGATGKRLNITDPVWAKHLARTGQQESIAVYFPSGPSDPLEVIVNHRPGTYYDTETWNYDQYTGRPLTNESFDAVPFSRSPVADKIKRLNYDIHVGSALGLPGKIMAFCASLVAASLPVTGFYLWWGRKKKKGRK